MPFLFSRAFYGEEPSVNNIFRLLDDVENYSRAVQGNQCAPRGHQSHLPTFKPRFDVRETENAYELHGELPGIDRENVNIEFTEPQTMVIRGSIERSYNSETAPAASAAPVEETPATHDAAETGEEFESIEATEAAETASINSHKATVTDEETEASKEKGEEVTPQAAPLAKKEGPTPQQNERFWHRERSVGKFARTFTFPSRIDESAVTASLNNGVLSVTIPKAAKHESRRINVV